MSSVRAQTRTHPPTRETRGIPGHDEEELRGHQPRKLGLQPGGSCSLALSVSGMMTLSLSLSLRIGARRPAVVLVVDPVLSRSLSLA